MRSDIRKKLNMPMGIRNFINVNIFIPSYNTHYLSLAAQTVHRLVTILDNLVYTPCILSNFSLYSCTQIIVITVPA